MKIFEMLAEQRITEAQRRGDFEHLPGRGQALDLEEPPFVSDEQRMINRILKNAGFAPSEVGLRKKLAELRQALVHETDSTRRAHIRGRIALVATELAEVSRRSQR